MALRTGIAPSVWAAEGEQAITTALDLLAKDNDTNESGREAPEGWELVSTSP